MKGERVCSASRIMRSVMIKPQGPLRAQCFYRAHMHFLGAGRNASFHRPLSPPWKLIKHILIETTI